MKSCMRRFKNLVGSIVLAILVFYASIVFSAVPEIINYQGSLSDAGGNPVNATLNITFTLYDDEVAGSSLWQEVQPVTVTNGQFSVQLGADTAGNPLSPTIFTDPIFLGIQVDTDAEMTPRQALTAVGYAFRAKTVENDTLNSLSCAPNEIPKFNGSVWVCAADIDTNTNAATICGAGTFLNGDGSCDPVVTDTNTNAATLCAAGTFLNGDGTCDPVVTDTNTTYSAGGGLTLNGTTFSIPVNGINSSQLAANSVGASEIASGAVRFSSLNNSAKGVGSGGVLVIPAAAFVAQNDLEQYQVSFGGGYITPRLPNNNFCIWAPAQLPNGVTVTRFDMIAWDNSATQNIDMDLSRLDIAGSGIGTILNVATAESSGVLAGIRTFIAGLIVSPLVDATNYQYYVSECWSSDVISASNTRLYAVRIFYN